MAFHISGKLCVLGVVIAALITAFSVPSEEGLPLGLSPQVQVLAAAPEAPPAVPPTLGPVANLRLRVRATAYNSLESQTDSSPHVTAIGSRTRFGVLAVSRDLLGRDVPYGSLVRLRDLGNYYSGRGAGAYQALLDSQGLFIVEDTMHPRKRQQIDLWFADVASAVAWGVREVELEVVRYGWNGPQLAAAEGDFEATPRLLANR